MKPRDSKHEHCRRLAAQVFTQLPEDHAEALLTLRYARDILRYLGKGWPTQAPSVLPTQLFPVRTGLAGAPVVALANQNDRPNRASRALLPSEPES